MNESDRELYEMLDKIKKERIEKKSSLETEALNGLNDCIDTEFNMIMLTEILPLISKAFCMLSARLDGFSMVQYDHGMLKDFCELKTWEVKKLICGYIDNQAQLFSQKTSIPEYRQKLEGDLKNKLYFMKD